MGVAKQIFDASKATINSLEDQLSGVFKPVPPRKEFVNALGNQIQAIRQQPTIIHRLSNTHFILLLVMGIVSLGTLLVIGLRVVTSLFSTHRRILRNE